MMTQHKALPPAEVVQELLDYDPDTGIFRWKVSRGRVKARNIAGNKRRDGYIEIRVQGGLYKAHRLAWLYVTGEDPGEQEVDHVNRKRSDNRFSNLRLTDGSGNQHNSPRRIDNTSGIKGVCWHKAAGKWNAQIRVNGKHIRLGYFTDRTEARRAVAKARNELHGEFARHN